MRIASILLWIILAALGVGLTRCSDSAVGLCKFDVDCPGTGICRDGACIASGCGDGIIQEGEACDPPSTCPTSCNDNIPCTSDTLLGSAEKCSAVCQHALVTQCLGGDSCCPAACSHDNDADCSATCGNGAVEPPETCDKTIAAGQVGACPTSCDDANACTTDQQSGSSQNCTAACSHTLITACLGGDGCCPSACNWHNDSDCVCTPNCNNKQCGDDGCGGLCGRCNTGTSSGLVCNDSFQCVHAQYDKDHLSPSDFSRTYAQMKNMYLDLTRLQATADKTVIREWTDKNDGSGALYSGHFGGFYAMPYLSAVNNPTLWQQSFNIGIAFSNGTDTCWEEPIDLQNGTWSPNKLTSSKAYFTDSAKCPNIYLHRAITGSKFGLPNSRAFAMKINVANTDSTSGNMGLLFWISIPQIGKIQGSVATWLGCGCECAGMCSSTGKTTRGAGDNEFYYYDSAAQICFPMKVITNQSGTFSYRIAEHTDAGHQEIYADFRSDGNPALSNVSNDTTDQNGSKLGVHFQPGSESALSSYNIVFVAAVGSAASASECSNKIASWLGSYNADTIETVAQDAWAQKLTGLFTNFPKFHSQANAFLNSIYINSFLHLPFATFKKDAFTLGAINNGYEDLNLKDTYIQEIPMYAKASGVYPWGEASASFSLALADPTALKEEIIKFLALDWSQYVAYDNILRTHRQSNEYVFDYWAMAKLVYQYITTTSDYAFMDQTHSGHYGTLSILDYLAAIADVQESKPHYNNTTILDFGTDWNLWEYNIHCDLGCRSVKYTFSPNAERYIQNKWLADIYRYKGDTAKQSARLAKATAIRDDIFSNLWFPSSEGGGTFGCLGGSKPFLPAPLAMRTLDLDGFFDGHESTKSDLIAYSFQNSATHFIGPYGFSSLPYSWKSAPAPCESSNETECCTGNADHWCVRGDYHGPGLYNGEVSIILKGLFKAGFKENAWTMLQKYSYLEGPPIWAEALSADDNTIVPAPELYQISEFTAGLCMSETLIQGLLGASTDTYVTTLYPRIPSGFGEVYLTDLNLQSHKFDVHINAPDTVYNIDMCIGCQRDGSGGLQNHSRVKIGTDGSKALIVQFRNLENGSYIVKIDDVAQPAPITASNNATTYIHDGWSGLHLLAIEKQ